MVNSHCRPTDVVGTLMCKRDSVGAAAGLALALVRSKILTWQCASQLSKAQYDAAFARDREVEDAASSSSSNATGSGSADDDSAAGAADERTGGIIGEVDLEVFYNDGNKARPCGWLCLVGTAARLRSGFSFLWDAICALQSQARASFAQGLSGRCRLCLI